MLSRHPSIFFFPPIASLISLLFSGVPVPAYTFSTLSQTTFSRESHYEKPPIFIFRGQLGVVWRLAYELLIFLLCWRASCGFRGLTMTMQIVSSGACFA
ncbi:uncharacterized protein BO97DRAFT_185788 [Aspergillus homomorphus CBS 101889]|uniref:Uncharacterized protein n=1 Tax=Aspergillus homomorphus (strain CBS 101889) TaxID=1450537 RepID=A0A395HNV3_ASPHC|nr:hypothetical protein BO97DRAFT_185788 [Aspergillus homomorphus CBS 101889]RAL09169.1 hypothetical protein BO97DRAFT_185788 [Aspergillus homomorphus CBS 101889]